MIPTAIRGWAYRSAGALRPAAPACGRSVSSSPYARTLDASSIKGRHLDDLFSFTGSEIETLLKISHALKDKMGVRKEVYQPLVRLSKLRKQYLSKATT